MRNRILIVLALVAATLVGYAASPASAAVRNVLLGRGNRTTATTIIYNTGGIPLYLKAPDGIAPLKVNSSTRVPRLNADRLDGVDSTSFSRLPQTGILQSGDPTYVYGLGYRARVQCPDGTVRTSGGHDLAYDASSPGTLTFSSRPVEPRGWEVVSNYLEGTRAYVVCLSSNGKPVPGTNAH